MGTLVVFFFFKIDFPTAPSLTTFAHEIDEADGVDGVVDGVSDFTDPVSFVDALTVAAGVRLSRWLFGGDLEWPRRCLDWFAVEAVRKDVSSDLVAELVPSSLLPIVVFADVEIAFAAVEIEIESSILLPFSPADSLGGPPLPALEEQTDSLPVDVFSFLPALDVADLMTFPIHFSLIN